MKPILAAVEGICLVYATVGVVAMGVGTQMQDQLNYERGLYCAVVGMGIGLACFYLKDRIHVETIEDKLE